MRPVHWPQGTQCKAGRESAEGTILRPAEPSAWPIPARPRPADAGAVTTSPAPLIIETRGLTKRFGHRAAVDHVDLLVPAGCAFGFLGHNGAGKTTVIRLLTGLTEPDAGTIRIGGRPLSGQREAVLARVGAMVEEPRFHLHLTGRENLRVIAAVRGPQARLRIEPALERVGLADRAGDRVGSYSQGMRQRLGIARCLLADPWLVILDEPMNGLDPGGILELRRLIADLVAEGRTVFVSSHLIDEIEKTCHAAAVIDRGRLIAQGPIAALLGNGGSSLEDWFLALTSRVGARS
jgi:ABC-2 type transport system ATP-binding protein